MDGPPPRLVFYTAIGSARKEACPDGKWAGPCTGEEAKNVISRLVL